MTINETYFFFPFFWRCPLAHGILVPRPGLEPMPRTLEGQSLNHWTARDVWTLHLYSGLPPLNYSPLASISPVQGPGKTSQDTMGKVYARVRTHTHTRTRTHGWATVSAAPISCKPHAVALGDQSTARLPNWASWPCCHLSGTGGSWQGRGGREAQAHSSQRGDGAHFLSHLAFREDFSAALPGRPHPEQWGCCPSGCHSDPPFSAQQRVWQRKDISLEEQKTTSCMCFQGNCFPFFQSLGSCVMGFWGARDTDSSVSLSTETLVHRSTEKPLRERGHSSSRIMGQHCMRHVVATR